MIFISQHLDSDGEKLEIRIKRSRTVEEMAAELVRVGCRFEVEILDNDRVYMTVEFKDHEEPLANAICTKDQAPDSVDTMIQIAHLKMFKEKYPS